MELLWESAAIALVLAILVRLKEGQWILSLGAFVLLLMFLLVPIGAFMDMIEWAEAMKVIGAIIVAFLAIYLLELRLYVLSSRSIGRHGSMAHSSSTIIQLIYIFIPTILWLLVVGCIMLSRWLYGF